MSKLNIYSVSDQYINYLRQDSRLKNVFDNKENRRKHTRKYLGIALRHHGFNYFIPFSSPKDNDYIINSNGEKSIRKSNIPIIRMTTTDTKTGNLELKGTLKLSNMIPVPASQLHKYNINAEQDTDYKLIVEKEYQFIKSNMDRIMKNASIIYNQKTKANELFKDGTMPGYLKSTVDFIYAEDKCNEFMILRGEVAAQPKTFLPEQS